MCRVKIHRAQVTAADINYMGSMTIPHGLMKQLDILPGEQCDVVNVHTGARWTTYAIAGAQDGQFVLNGAAARHGVPGDLIIIMVYAQMDDAEARRHRLNVAHMTADNKVDRIEEAL